MTSNVCIYGIEGTLKEDDKPPVEEPNVETAIAKNDIAVEAKTEPAVPVKRTRESKSDGDDSDDNIGKPKCPKPTISIPILRGKFLTRPRR